MIISPPQVASLAMSLIYKMHTTFDDSIKDRINDKYEESIKTVMGRLTANANGACACARSCT